MQKAQLIGKTFGRLTVTGEAKGIAGKSRWVCVCTCGVVKEVNGTHLTRRDKPTLSCGCMARELAKERLPRVMSSGYKGYRKYSTVEDLLGNATDNNGCKEWNGPLHKNGYAKIGKTAVFKTPLLHREVFRMKHGYSPKVVMHKCDNRKCINPDHLVGGTQQDNIDDMMNKQRHWRMKK